jgi:hypothetical protein
VNIWCASHQLSPRNLQFQGPCRQEYRTFPEVRDARSVCSIVVSNWSARIVAELELGKRHQQQPHPKSDRLDYDPMRGPYFPTDDDLTPMFAEEHSSATELLLNLTHLSLKGGVVPRFYFLVLPLCPFQNIPAATRRNHLRNIMPFRRRASRFPLPISRISHTHVGRLFIGREITDLAIQFTALPSGLRPIRFTQSRTDERSDIAPTECLVMAGNCLTPDFPHNTKSRLLNDEGICANGKDSTRNR